jgi:hypothetical protein
LARHFGTLPLDGTLQQDDLVYYNLFGHQVVRYAAEVGVAIALLLLVGTLALIAVGLRRNRLTWQGILIGAAVFLPLVLGATLISGGVWYLLRVLDPRLQVFLIGVSYDRELYTLAFVILSAGLMLAGYALLRRRSAVELGVGALIWWTVLAGLTAFQLPGSSYIFALPGLFALIMFAVTLFTPHAGGWLRTAVLALGSAGAMLIFAPVVNFLGIFSGRAEVLMGLPVIAMMPALFVALLTGLLLPALDEISRGRRAWAAAAIAALAVVLVAGIALTADFSEERPKPNMVAYTLNADTDEAYWVTGGANIGGQRQSLLDEWTMQFFGNGVEETLYSPWGAFMEPFVPAYRSPAPPLDLPAPTVEVVADSVGESGQRALQLRIVSPRDASALIARISTEGKIVGATLAGEPVADMSPESPRSTFFFSIYAAAGEGLEMSLTLAEAAPVTVLLEDHAYGLPEIDNMSIQPRPDWMIPSPTFISDATVVQQTVTLP